MSYQAFRIPNNILFGEGAFEYLGTLKGERAVIVTGGSSMKRLGFLDKAKEILEKAGMEVEIIEGVEPNPSIGTVNRGAEKMRQFKPDWIIALGGGSALDAAKIMWVFYEYPELKFEDILEINSIPTLRKKAQFVAIPSTSGTASEITAASVITDTKKHIKYPIISQEIIPDIAIVDPALPAKMPPHITANTGMDVLTHAIESYVSTGANSYTSPLAMEAIKLVFEYLPRAYKDGNDMEARYHMHNASTIAGMAFNNSFLGLVHSLAHKIGGMFGITHGLANAILLPYICKYNMKNTDRYAEIEKVLGVSDLVETLKEFNRKLDIPLNFAALEEVQREKFEEVLSKMSENAYKDPCTLTNPRPTSPEDIEKIYRYAFEGKDIDF
ncbi:butanol dehydrogenase [Anoxybacter fermentans]|uniref:Butanol dehydrogenase n=1 Tax=Anoxybacter fermentans TaxID=1323375 RepID=A0A3Q9HSL1_9FIRM|nr:iron-containing alcohol dehydrogenase [Anoxybacter fermentans]AZR74644.1 butanol dehydrogenase [Anoxybacter fermentans]